MGLIPALPKLPLDFYRVFLHNFIITDKTQILNFRLCNEHTIKWILMKRLQFVQGLDMGRVDGEN